MGCPRHSSLGAGANPRASERIINEVAQGFRAPDGAVDWFTSLERAEQKEALREVVHYSMQARASAHDARDGLLRSGVKPTMTPAVLIVRKPVLEQMGKIINLPHSAVADTRRRERECQGTCRHAWHALP
ncbi:DUF5958 family protein [Streptomyces chisholmiae]|uniref:DUF5958 family protein n=1 Tax=Streptomyces chisholmiae TaxID=3075540 RepID=UPI00374E13B6